MTSVAIKRRLQRNTGEQKPRFRALRSLSADMLGVRALCLLIFAAGGLIADSALSGVGAMDPRYFGAVTIGAIAFQIGISVWAVALDLIAWPIYALTRSEDVSFVIGLVAGVFPALAGGVGFTSIFVSSGMIG